MTLRRRVSFVGVISTSLSLPVAMNAEERAPTPEECASGLEKPADVSRRRQSCPPDHSNQLAMSIRLCRSEKSV